MEPNGYNSTNTKSISLIITEYAAQPPQFANMHSLITGCNSNSPARRLTRNKSVSPRLNVVSSHDRYTVSSVYSFVPPLRDNSKFHERVRQVVHLVQVLLYIIRHVPVNWLSLRSSSWRADRSPSSEGITPAKPP